MPPRRPVAPTPLRLQLRCVPSHPPDPVEDLRRDRRGSARREPVAPLHRAARAAPAAAHPPPSVAVRPFLTLGPTPRPPRSARRGRSRGRDGPGAGPSGRGRRLGPSRRARLGRPAEIGRPASGRCSRAASGIAGDRLRLSTHLVSVDQGFDLWSETFDQPAADLLPVRDSIARSVVNTLRNGARPGLPRPPRRPRSSPTFGAARRSPIAPASPWSTPNRPLRASARRWRSIPATRPPGPAWPKPTCASWRSGCGPRRRRPKRRARRRTGPWRSTASTRGRCSPAARCACCTTAPGPRRGRISAAPPRSSPAGPPPSTGSRTCFWRKDGPTARSPRAGRPSRPARSTPACGCISPGTT